MWNLQADQRNINLLRRPRSRPPRLLPTTPMQRIHETRHARHLHRRRIRRFRRRRPRKRHKPRRLPRPHGENLLPRFPRHVPLPHRRRRHFPPARRQRHQRSRSRRHPVPLGWRVFEYLRHPELSGECGGQLFRHGGDAVSVLQQHE